ncbi:Integrator complex subunit 2 [Halotydeus destructor]|nr:Integrator complex subunit 2 [Halotydeus destructor]
MRDLDADAMESMAASEIRPLMPSLVRMALCMSPDSSQDWVQRKKKILKKLSSNETANSIVSLLSVDFHALDIDVKKEVLLRQKMGVMPGDSVLISSLTDGLALEFERSDGIRKLRLVLSEFFAIQSACRQTDLQSSSQLLNGIKPSELFDNEVYLDELADVFCIAIAELPNSLILTELAETFLYVKNGCHLITRLVANSPESFQEVCSSLIYNGDKQDEENFVGRNRMNALRVLCQMNPQSALMIRTIAVDSCKMPGLVVMVTLDHLKNANGEGSDIVPFVTGLVLGSEDKTRTWFTQYIRIGQKKIEQGQPATLTNLKTELQNRLMDLIDKDTISSPSVSDYTLVKVCSLLRLYCALRGVASMKFSDEENSLILKIVTMFPPATAAGIKLASISLCIILSCSSLISTLEAERRAVNWIQTLVKEEKYFGPLVKAKSSLGELLLLIAIHFHSNQINAISDLISGTLQVKVQTRQNILAKMKTVFTQDIFPEEMIAHHAIKVPVTPRLSSEVAGFLPVHCVYQLLRSRAFGKYKVPIHDWILNQLRNSVAPIHPVLPSLIETYVHSIIVPETKSHLQNVNRNEPIAEADLIKIFKYRLYMDEDENMDADAGPACHLTSQILALLYLLMYKDVRLTHTKQNLQTKILRYNAEFMFQIPIFYLVQQARKDIHKYGTVFPILLKLLSTHYPHLCLVQDWLDSHTSDDWLTSSKLDVSVVKRNLSSAFLFPDDMRRARALNLVLKLPQTKLWSMVTDIVELLPDVLSLSTSRAVLDRIERIWWRLNSIFPDSLWVMTINVLKVQKYRVGKSRPMTWDDIVADPHHVLRCDERVFRNPVVMKIVLHMLSAFLAASKTHLTHHLLEKPSKNHEEEKNREELRNALIKAQDGAAIQILLETCLPVIDEEHDEIRSSLEEVQQIICTNLHQMFILDQTLAKLVHFQTYNHRLLKLTVESVPSMHICLEFIPELLSQPDLSKQVFAIDLCSHLCIQYATPKFLSVAKLCFNVSSTLLSILSGNKRSQFFIPVLPALIRLCQAFPPLQEDASSLLNQLQQICLSKLAATSSSFISSTAAIQKYRYDRYKHMSQRQLQIFQDTLEEDDCLFFNIQKAISELEGMKTSV